MEQFGTYKSNMRHFGTYSKIVLLPTQGKNLPTNALILLSDDELRKKLFPYAKIECARFKGAIPSNFIDKKPKHP